MKYAVAALEVGAIAGSSLAVSCSFGADVSNRHHATHCNHFQTEGHMGYILLLGVAILVCVIAIVNFTLKRNRRALIVRSYVDSVLRGPSGTLASEVQREGGLHYFLLNNHNNFGDIFRVWLDSTSVAICFNSPQLIKRYMMPLGSRPVEAQEFLLPLVGKDDLQFADTATAKKMRAEESAAFQPAVLSQYFNTIAEHSAEFTDSLFKRCEKDKRDVTISVGGELERLTFNIMGMIAFGENFKLEAEKITPAYHTVLSELFQRDQEWIPRKWLSFTARQKKYQNALKTLFTSMNELLAQTRASDKSSAPSMQFLSHMMNVTSSTLGRAYTDDELCRKAIGVLMAGFETTSTTLTWALYLLAQNPDAESKLFQEVDRLQAVTPQNIAELPYMEAVLNETMRLYPVGFYVVRKLEVPLRLEEQITLPKGTTLYGSTYSLHLREDIWASPNRFRPERFLEPIEPNSFLPWGIGSRMCFGKYLAMFEMKIILATLLKRFCVVGLEPGQKVEAQDLFILKPKNDIRIVLRYRKTA